MNDNTHLQMLSGEGLVRTAKGVSWEGILQSVSELTVVGMRYWMNGQMLTG